MKNKKNKIDYFLDKFVTKGFIAQFIILLISIAFIVLLFGFIAAFFSSSVTLQSGLWQSLMHILDQGTLSGDELDDVAYIIVMLIVTILGMAFTGTIVGIINNAMSERLDELKKGHSKIMEDGHVVIIGFDENVYSIISEQLKSDENWEGNKKIVVFDEMEKAEMEQKYLEHAEYDKKQEKNMKYLLFRSGDVISDNTYRIASLENARSIIINKEEDFDVIRVLLGVVRYLKTTGSYGSKNMPTIVTMLHEEENVKAAKIAAELDKYDVGGKVKIMYFEDVLARIFSQVCKQPGLSWVISELVDYDDSEIYIENEYRDKNTKIKLPLPLEEGDSFQKITRMFNSSTPIGILRGEEIILNPIGRDSEYRGFKSGDKVIHIAEDDNMISLIDSDHYEAPIGNPPAFIGQTDRSYNIVVFGWSVPLPKILKNIDEYAKKGNPVTIISDKEIDKTAVKEKKIKKVEINYIENIDPYDWKQLEKEYLEKISWDQPEMRPTDFILVCQDYISPEEADAKTAVLLLKLRSYLEKKKEKYGKKFNYNITTEMNLPKDQRLLQNRSLSEFIVGSEIANKLLVQGSNTPDVFNVIIKLLQEKENGSELYMRYVMDYVDIESEFNWNYLAEEAEKRGEIAIGWLKAEGSDGPEICINPKGAGKTHYPANEFKKKDRLVVLAEN